MIRLCIAAAAVWLVTGCGDGGNKAEAETSPQVLVLGYTYEAAHSLTLISVDADTGAWRVVERYGQRANVVGGHYDPRRGVFHVYLPSGYLSTDLKSGETTETRLAGGGVDILSGHGAWGD